MDKSDIADGVDNSANPPVVKPKTAKIQAAKVNARATATAIQPAQSGSPRVVVAPVSVAPIAGDLPPVVEDSFYTIAQQTAEESRESVPSKRRRWIPVAAPSWMVSLILHIGLILVLAMITLDPVTTALNILTAAVGDDATEIEEFDLESPQLDDSVDDLDASMAPPAPTFDSSQALTQVSAPEVTQFEIQDTDKLLDTLENNLITQSILPSAASGQMTLAQMSSALNGRTGTGRSEMLQHYGGTAASEKAVALALKWIAEHQADDGGWTFNHTLVCHNRQCPDHGDMAEARNGATALALLPFLGAGQTHLDGEYQQTVRRGLAFLINRMKATSGSVPVGSWWEQGGRMYSHGLCAITMCEAYAMTEDRDLLQPAQLSLNYLVYAQDPKGGGWRYKPQEPGDTSVVGWCLMALKSGKMGHLVVPQQTINKAEYFLDYVMTKNGANYGYSGPSPKARSATSAVGTLCRMYMGGKKESTIIQNGVQFLDKSGPKLNDLYYSYYATQVMRHNGGDSWERWNRKMRDPLIKLQVKDGHAAGSWYTGGGGHGRHGGRLMATSLATMMLEVYYRHMPLYSEASAATEFEL